MTRLRGASQEVFESLRGRGVSEAAARAAVADPRVADQLLDVQSGLTFGRLTAAEARKRLARIAEVAATLPPALPQRTEAERRALLGLGPVQEASRFASTAAEAQYELTAARAFGRAPKSWAVEETRRQEVLEAQHAEQARVAEAARAAATRTTPPAKESSWRPQPHPKGRQRVEIHEVTRPGGKQQ